MKVLVAALLFVALLVGAASAAAAWFLRGSGASGPPPASQVIASITPSSCSFTPGTQNGAVCTLTVTMSPTAPAFSGTLGLCTGLNAPVAGCPSTNVANSGGFQLASCSAATCVVQQSSASGGTPAGTYTDITTYAQQVGISNSPQFQQLTLTGTAPGGVITSFTVQNSDPSNAVTPGASGYPIIFGQSWARGDLPTSPTGSMHPICKDHANGAVLTCQFDQIATNRENGDDGSWRHASFSVLLPATSPQYTSGSLVACTASPCTGTFQVDFVSQPGAYSPIVQGSINDICSGHDINLKLTDVRNQDDTLRGPTGFTGSLTFDVCSNLTNTGRDAPRQFAQGAVRNGWLIQGPPVYSNGAKDPLLYVKCYMSQTYTLSGTLGPLEHECSVHNSWMNVAAGSSGNSGAPGPVGFTNDPQAIVYRPVLYDGSTVILDWGTTYWDQTVPNTAVNVSNKIWTIPGLGDPTSPNAWGTNNSFRYTASGTPPTATENGVNPFQNGKLVYAVADIYGGCNFLDTTYNAQHQHFSRYMGACVSFITSYTSQGTGNSTFSWRITHPHFAAWVTDDVTALPNWAPVGGTTRYVSPVYPLLSTAQKTYWYTTGQIPPLSQVSAAYYGSGPEIGDNTKQENFRYAPIDLGPFNLGTGVGGRLDIGLQNEYVSRWWVTQDPGRWKFIGSGALVGQAAQGVADLLNEATGRIPATNNGSPAANHGGSGTPYTGLGALFPTTNLFSNVTFVSVVAPLENVPYNDCGGCTATSGWALYPLMAENDNTHQSAYALGIYQVSGREIHLEALQAAAGRAIYNGNADCNLPFGFQGALGGDNRHCQLANGVTYYAILAPGGERRGSAWAMRDTTVGATYGGDSWAGPERTFFNDAMTETYWANQYCTPSGSLWCGMIDPPTPNSGPVIGGGVNGTAYNLDGTGAFTPISNPVSSTFFDGYITQASYLIWNMIHNPLAKDYLSMQYRLYATTCGDGGTTPVVVGSPSSMICGNYYYGNNLKTMTPTETVNLTDASDWQTNYYQVAQGTDNLAVTAGSSVMSITGSSSNNFIAWLPFDEKVRFYNYPSGNGFTCSTLPDQLVEGTWYHLVNHATYPSYQVATTTGGTPLGPYTVGGNPYSGTLCGVQYRWDAGVTDTMPGQGQLQFFLSGGYASYSYSAITGLIDINQSLGSIYALSNVQFLRNNMLTRYNNNSGGYTLQNSTPNDCFANCTWDPTIVVK